MLKTENEERRTEEYIVENRSNESKFRENYSLEKKFVNGQTTE